MPTDRYAGSLLADVIDRTRISPIGAVTRVHWGALHYRLAHGEFGTGSDLHNADR
jgi:hypothetical protein